MTTRGKLGLLASLYFAQGLPFGFFIQALPAMLRREGLSLPLIGLANLLALPWAVKFLWAPAADRQAPGPLGRRKAWIVPLQAAGVALLGGVAFLDPAQSLGWILGGVFLVNLAAALQDTATDGLAIELLAPTERGLGNGVQVAGYRVGMIAGGGALLIALDHWGWQPSLLAMAALLAASSLPILFHRENQSSQRASAPAGLGEALAQPGMVRWLAVIGAYKFGDSMANAMIRPFLVDSGWSLADIGWLLGTGGFAAGLFGALVGGWAAGRVGRRQALGTFGVLQAFAVGLYALPALDPALSGLLGASCLIEHFSGGLATAALFTVMMDRSRIEAASTDYTLQASAVVVATGMAAGMSGFVADALGYAGLFAFSALASLAAVAILVRSWDDAPAPATLAQEVA